MLNDWSLVEMKLDKFKWISRLNGILSKRVKRSFYLSVLLMLVSGGFELLVVVFVLPIVANGLAGGVGSIKNVSGMISGDSVVDTANSYKIGLTVVIGAGIARVLSMLQSGRVSMLIGNEISTTVFAEIIDLEYEEVLGDSSSRYIAAMSTSVGALMNAVNGIVQALMGMITGCSVGIGMAVVDMRMTILSASSVAACYVLLLGLTKERVKRNSAVFLSSNKGIVEITQDLVALFRNVRLSAARGYFLESLRIFDRRARETELDNRLISQLPKLLVETLIMAILLSAIWAASGEKGNDVALIEAVALIGFGLLRLLPSFQSVFGGINAIFNSTTQIDDLMDLMRSQGVISRIEELDAAKETCVVDRISWRNIKYRRPGSGFELIVDELDLVKGQCLGVQGKTGSGKSTFLDITMGLLVPNNGKMLVDGKDVHMNEETRAGWQKSIAYVTQDSTFKDCSIVENIAIGMARSDVDEERIREATRCAQIDEFIQSLPDGYNTIVGERGVRLSGGQRQRLNIARALYARKQLLILDEATSALDAYTESVLIGNLMEMMGNVTILVVGHKPSALSMCTKLVTVVDGKVKS